MCNATSKIMAVAAAMAALSACSQPDPEKIAAEDLVQRAETSLAAGDCQQALALMDSVDKQYPGQIESRRKVTALRPRAMADYMMRQIEHADSIIAFTQQDLAELEPQMKHVSGDDLEGYYVVKNAYNPNFINTTSFEPRVNDADFGYYIVAQVQGAPKFGLRQVALHGPDGQAMSEILPAESARRMAIEGSEVATFLPEEVAALGVWATDNSVKCGTIIGAKGERKIAFSTAQADAFATAYRYATARQKLKSATNLRINLEKKLQVARDQVAQTLPDDQIEDKN